MKPMPSEMSLKETTDSVTALVSKHEEWLPTAADN
jgi:hypothetical protein